MSNSKSIAHALAKVFVNGDWTLEDMVQRGGLRLEKHWRWLRPLARRLIDAFGPHRPSAERVGRFIQLDEGFRRAFQRHEIDLSYQRQPRPVMSPAPGRPSTWDVPSLVTEGELADWLEISPGELGFLADVRNLESTRPHGPLRHYRYHWHPKRSGGSARLIEKPKWRLKSVQRRLLHGILNQIPPHDAAHGFRKGHSIRMAVEPHVGQQVVVRMDLRDFFPSIPRRRITGVFRVAGYPERIARLLSALCTNTVPSDVWKTFPEYAGDQRRHESLYSRLHLPQGSPTSPALANLCSYRLDARLTGLAKSLSSNYTRYADDLVFSGTVRLAHATRHLQTQAYLIALEEGFEINLRKTRVMRQSVRQQAMGIVINRKPNIRRADYDRLKAILTNCIRHGAESQNKTGHPEFRAHLAGRIAHVDTLNPSRGDKLRSLFEQIDWDSSSL